MPSLFSDRGYCLAADQPEILLLQGGDDRGGNRVQPAAVKGDARGDLAARHLKPCIDAVGFACGAADQGNRCGRQPGPGQCCSSSCVKMVGKAMDRFCQWSVEQRAGGRAKVRGGLCDMQPCDLRCGRKSRPRNPGCEEPQPMAGLMRRLLHQRAKCRLDQGRCPNRPKRAFGQKPGPKAAQGVWACRIYGQIGREPIVLPTCNHALKTIGWCALQPARHGSAYGALTNQIDGCYCGPAIAGRTLIHVVADQFSDARNAPTSSRVI